MLNVGDMQVALPAVALLGVGVGLIAGMFGVGGGFLLIPLLHVVLGVPIAIAIGSGLCQTIATALGSLLRYRKMGYAENRFDILLLGGSMLGVMVGASLLDFLSGMGSTVIFGRELPVIRVIVTACYLGLFSTIALLLWFKTAHATETKAGPLARVRIPPYIALPVAGLDRVSAPLTCYVGLGVGFLSGLLGIGGGVVLIPIMLYGYGFNIRKCAGTGIVMILIVATLGTIQHVRLGNVHLGLAMTLMIGSALAAQVGASLTRSLSPTLLRRGLAIVIIAANAALLLKLLK